MMTDIPSKQKLIKSGNSHYILVDSAFIKSFNLQVGQQISFTLHLNSEEVSS